MSQVTPPQTETLQTVLAFIARRGITEKTFGAYAVNDSSFVDRLRVGKATFAIGQRALEYIAGQEAAAAKTASIGTGQGDVSCAETDSATGTPSRKMRVA